MNWPLCAPAAHCTFDRICMEMIGSGTDQAGDGRNCRRAGGLELDKRFDDD